MATTRTPVGLGPGGRALWRDITDKHVLDEAQKVQLLEACRAKDRLDKMDEILRGDVDTWMTLLQDFNSETSYELRVTSVLQRSNETANSMKQLLAAMRLPDEVTGKRPQRRSARGAQAPDIPGGKPRPVSSLDRARMAREGG